MNPKEFYRNGESDRDFFTDRAIKYSKLTLPYLIRDDDDDSSTTMKDKYGQSFCGRAVNSLKAKIGMSLMPPASSSFRLDPTPEKLAELGREIIAQSGEGAQEDEAIAEIRAIIGRATSQINKEIDAQSIRDTIFEIVNQLLVVGSVIMEKIPNDGIHYHPLSSFVVKLNKRGKAVKMCIVEKLFDVPEEFGELDEKDEYELYTMLVQDSKSKKWTMSQQIDDVVLEDIKTYTNEKMPFKYTGWTYMVGDAYHRPYAEDYYEDMNQFSDISHMLTDGGIASAKTIIFVDERGGRTKQKNVADAKNMDIVHGRADDVSVFQLGKNYDFQMPAERAAELKRDIAAAFLMNESATREAERVTAAEIQFMAQELESTSLAGTYSKLSENIIGWVIKQVMGELGLTFKELGVKIVVGLDALGRSNEARNLDSFTQTVMSVGAQDRLNPDELVSRYSAFYSVDPTNLVKTGSQVAKEQQAQQEKQNQQVMEQSGAQSMGQEAGKVAGQAASQAVSNQG